MSEEMIELKDKEISFSVLFKVLKKYFVVVLIATIIFGVIAGAYSALFQKTKYTAKSEFLVKNILPTAGYINPQMIETAAYIASTCVEVSTKDILAKRAVREHELDKYFQCPESEAVKYVMSMISASKSDIDSSIFSITISSLNADHTYRVMLAVQDVMPDVVKTVTTADENSVSAPSLSLVTSVETEKDIRVVTPSLRNMVVFGAAIGAVISYVAMLIIYINDKKVYDVESVQSAFNNPIIGTIPQWISKHDSEVQRMSRKKLLARDISKSGRCYDDKFISKATPFAITESFKQLRTNLSYSIAAEKCPVFAITSDFSGAGKSVISSNLAASFAMLGKKTLLVEGDMRCPDLKHIFADSSNVGLSDLLSGNANMSDDVAKKFVDDKLSVIFSGRIPPNPSELLGSNKMLSLIEEWKEEYDVVIIDLPPVFEVADASVISSFVSGYVLVARCGQSDTAALAASISAIKKVHGNICGFVVNDVNIKVGRYSLKYNKYSSYKRYAESAENNEQAEVAENNEQ